MKNTMGIWLGCALACTAFGAAGAVQRCVGPDGKVTYQAEACPGGASARTLPPVAAADPPAERAVRAPAIPVIPDREPRLPRRAERTATEPAMSPARAAPPPAVPRSATVPTFGEPVVPVTTPQLALSRNPPPRAVADGAEVVVVSGYRPDSAAVQVAVDRPGKAVVLVLTSHEKVLWRVTATPSTQLRAILVSSDNGQSGVITSLNVPGYVMTLDSATSVDNARFRAIVERLAALLGTERVDTFRGAYDIPAQVSIRSVDLRRPELTVGGIQAQAAAVRLAFDLTAIDGKKVPWTNAGPSKADAAVQYRAQGKRVDGSAAGLSFELTSEGLFVKAPGGGAATVAALPTNFPQFSWPTDVARDTHNDIVAVVTLGGEGFLYRYDARRRQWLDHRSLNGVDITSLAYDAKARRFVAWTSDGELLAMDETGKALSSTKLAARLPGYLATFDQGNQQPPRLTVVPSGDHVALVQYAGASVRHVWTVDVAGTQAVLTYKAPVAR